MKSFFAKFILFTLFLIGFNSLFAQENIVLQSAKKELERAMNTLKQEPNPPYFISYGITETTSFRLTATLTLICA
jgi:hypothetical protein